MNTFWTLFETALAQSLVAALWQGVLLGGLAALALSTMRRSSAAARHTVGLLFLLAMVAAPAWQLADTLLAPTAETLAAGGLPVHWAGNAAPGLAPAIGNWQAPAWLAWAWGGGVLVMLVRLGGGWWWLHTLEKQTSDALLPPAWQARAQRLRSALGITRPIALRLLPGEASPFTARAWRPVIWLPISLFTRLAPEQIDALIAHELAHIRRLDWLWNGLQCTVEALLFFHPVVWWLSRRVRIEREQACDQLAASVCGDALVVAEALAALGEAMNGPGTRGSAVPVLVQAAQGGSLQQRVAHLLSAGHPAAPRWGVAAALALVLCAGGVWAAQAAGAATSATSAASATAPVPATPATPATPAADPWWTTVGNSTRIRINEKGQVRDYHAWVSPNGEHHETFRIDGQLAEITPEVRAWIDAHHQIPQPPTPPTVPDVDIDEDDGLPLVPPLPPLPPAPPKIVESPAYQAVLAALQRDTAAVQRLGTPIQLADDCGPCKIEDDKASLTLSARGPKGQITIKAESRLVKGQWQVSTLDLRPSLAQRLGLAH